MQERLERERAFHDEKYTSSLRESTNKYLRVRQSPHAFKGLLSGSGKALDYGCGTGDLTAFLAQSYEVTGVDISPEAIRLADKKHELDFRVMNAESLDFPDDTFDLVAGRAILHHLDLDTAYAEVARVLKPDGKGVFLEPLGHNPLINLYRTLTPRLRSPDEQPMRLDDIRKAKEYFSCVRATFWDLFTLTATPFRNAPGFGPLLRVLGRMDAAVLKRKHVRRFAWMAVIELSQPRTAARGR
jgi:SAM-dependent methyltransferase